MIKALNRIFYLIFTSFYRFKPATCYMQGCLNYIIIDNYKKTYYTFPNMNSALKAQLTVKKQDYEYHHDQKYQNLCKNSSNSKQFHSSNPKNAIYSAGVRDSKQTLSTDISLTEEQLNIVFDQQTQNLLDFTFYYSNIRTLPFQQLPPPKNKYSNASIECVIFYALLFNQLHLQQINESLPKITASSLKCYNIVKKIMFDYDEEVAKKQSCDYIFPQSTFRLIENRNLSLKTKKQWLKNLIDKINRFIVAEIVAKIPRKEHKQRANIQDLMLQRLAKHFGIKIKFQCQFKICFYGEKGSNICLSIQYQPDSSLFRLKKIKCQEGRI